MADKFIGRSISDPCEQLVAQVAANMLKEPNFYSASDQKRTKLLAALESVLQTDPEFICKLAFYSREKLNIRATSNFLLAYAASRPQTKAVLSKYFRAAIRLPNDLLEVVQHVQELTAKEVPEGHYYIPKALKREVRLKFKEFSIYQLGKYCSEGRRKRQAKKEKGKELPEERLQLAMKRLVRLCHIHEPADTVCALIGVRYPASEEEFKATSLAATAAFDPSRAGKRMKIPTPVTWETELSARGNSAQVWEELIKSRKLPFMAMLRNLRNLLLTGVDRDTHEMVLSRLQDPGQVAQSRLFPFRFFSAFEALNVDLEELRKLKEDPTYQPAPPSGKRGLKRGRGRSARGRHARSLSPPQTEEEPKPRKKLIPKELPTETLLAAYKAALETSIKLATTANVLPVLGHSVIFCDVSGSMGAKLSGGSGLGSVRTCKDAGVLLGLMLRYVCESSDVIAFSSPGSHQKCWFPISLQSENILENMKAVEEQSSVLGGGTDFPYDFVHSLIQEHKHVDQMFVFSDMMIAPGEQEMSGTSTGGQSSISQVLEQYRQEVNVHMKFVTVDLAVGGRDILGASFDADYLNVKVHGYSDAILALVSELQQSQVEAVDAFVQEHLK